MKNKTEIIFLLDRSGSMGGLESDTIGGFNSLIRKQCQLPGETILTTVLFDHDYELLWNGVDANTVLLTNEQYFVRGTTALLDAIGRTIMDVSYRLSNTAEDKKPSNVIFVITTDGHENASREYSSNRIRSMIQKQQDIHGWEFIFLGANMDAVTEADNIGIKVEYSFDFDANETGVIKMYDIIHEELSQKRVNNR
ncbi:vWA domain-containing protein [Ornithinibacillus californiensis]|uniref:vWA domain-containing protein n=1 Tax=Ornithinibacillus californiensis TaxID=161536 RepID=UPI000ACA70D6|nr:vWA domain-containing protein [Ornithinibacillus californiensis]